MNSPDSWKGRPAEVSNLFNPAYSSVLLNRVCDGYQSASSEGLPYSLAFLAAPLVLYPDFASLLPSSSRTKLHIWLQQNPEILFDFAERAKQLGPHVREAIWFGIANKALELNDEGRIVATPVKGLKQWETAHLRSIVVKRSTLVGKLFGFIKDDSSVYAMFGVRP